MSSTLKAEMSLRRRPISPQAWTMSGTTLAHSNASFVASFPAAISAARVSTGMVDDKEESSIWSLKVGMYFSLHHFASSR